MALTFTRDAGNAGGASLQVIDYCSQAKISTPAVAGVCTVQFDPVAAGEFWLIERVTVLNTSTAASSAYLYEGDPAPTNFRDGTSRGNLDVADEASPILIDSTRYVTVQWTGCSAGAVGTATLQYQRVQRA